MNPTDAAVDLLAHARGAQDRETWRRLFAGLSLMGCRARGGEQRRPRSVARGAVKDADELCLALKIPTPPPTEPSS